MGAEPPVRILVVAGEASGDQAAAPVVAALARLRPEWAVEAVGGPKLRAAGAAIIQDYADFAVMGFAEVLRRLPSLRRHLRRLSASLRSGRYDLFLPVDAPGLNLRLAGAAKGAGLPVLYFIAPQVWAWGKRRVAQLSARVDRLGLILPFEKDWFAAEGLAGDFVGHPILERDPPLAGAEATSRLGLLPGSRAQEVSRHLPLMLAAASRLAADRPELSCELLESPTLPPGFYDPLLAGAALPVARRREDSLDFLARQGAAIVASGTATLETAVVGVPMAVVYRTGAANYWLARRLVQVDHVALANLVAGRRVAPEFIQGAATPAALAAAIGPLLEPGPARDAQREAWAGVRAALGGPGCGERVARLAVELVEGA